WMPHLLTGCSTFFGRNRPRPQSHHTLANLMLPSTCQPRSQSLKVTYSLLLKVTPSLPGKATDSLSLKVADSLPKVTYSLLLKVTLHQYREVAYSLPLTRRFHWQ